MSHAKQTNRVTPASNETLFTLLETLPGALFVINDAATIVYANASAQVFTGTTREDICGKPLWRGAPQLGSATLYQAVQQTAQTRAPTEVEYVSSVTGTWLHVQLSPTAGGLMVQVHQGKTEALREETFSQSGRLSIEDVDSLFTRIGVLTLEGITLEINEVPLAEAQIRREEVIGHLLTETRWWSFYPTSQEQLRAAIARASRGETVRFETVVYLKEDLDRHLEVAITPHRDANHHVTYLVVASIDITERKRAEQQLKASEENWRTLAETVPQIVWAQSPDGLIEYTNQRWSDYTGLTPKPIQSNRWAFLQFIHPDDRAGNRALRQHALDRGDLFEHEERIRNGQTGEYRWFLTRGMPVRDEAGQIIKWFGTSTDIEDQKRTEQALRQSQMRLRALIDSNIIGIVSVEEEGFVIVEANEAWLHMTGYRREDVQSRTLNQARYTVPEDAPLFERAVQEITARGQYTPFETETICRDGSRLPVLVGGVLFQEQPRQIVVFVLDNSARKELEQRKDDFISMASHELRNPLTVLKLQTTLLRRQLARQGTLDEVPALASMETQIHTLTRLVEDLLDVSKIQAGKLEYIRETVDLDALLREIAETMQQTNPSHRILVHGSAQTSLIGDPDRLGQVFTNLLSNAIKYTPNAETVEVDLSTSEDAVTVRVHDHGVGIPREQRDKIFERFYRVTDSKQKKIAGLGMGLYIVAEIVKSQGGTITVDSEVGKGSTFTVTLPTRRMT
ncbi:MAG TPA: PAS domain S-box protein [Ktedonobacteraceae bacterium]